MEMINIKLSSIENNHCIKINNDIGITIDVDSNTISATNSTQSNLIMNNITQNNSLIDVVNVVVKKKGRGKKKSNLTKRKISKIPNNFKSNNIIDVKPKKRGKYNKSPSIYCNSLDVAQIELPIQVSIIWLIYKLNQLYNLFQFNFHLNFVFFIITCNNSNIFWIDNHFSKQS